MFPGSAAPAALPYISTHAPIRLQIYTPLSDILIGPRIQCTIGPYTLYVSPYR